MTEPVQDVQQVVEETFIIPEILTQIAVVLPQVAVVAEEVAIDTYVILAA